MLKAAPGTMLTFVSSVAGERGRRTNFVYGAAKAASNAYAQGLRALLAPDGVGVLTIKLGYMDTPPCLWRGTAGHDLLAEVCGQIDSPLDRAPPHGRVRAWILAFDFLHSSRHTGAPFHPSSDSVTALSAPVRVSPSVQVVEQVFNVHRQVLAITAPAEGDARPAAHAGRRGTPRRRSTASLSRGRS
jgi:NAD(P)-dependent dehydrogenase (short-subunit alcohol dehydrogenase family)